MSNYLLNPITLTDDEINDLTVHPLANLLPFMDKETMLDLQQSLKESGLRDAIILIRDKETNKLSILDGRHRYAFGFEAAVKLKFKEFIGSEAEARSLVLDLNCVRRHLSESQRAMIAADLVDTAHGDNQHRSNERCSQGKAARKASVSIESVKRARKVKYRGCPELIDAVKTGKIVVSRAAIIAEETHVHQKDILERVLSDGKPRNTTTDKKFTFTCTEHEARLIEAVISVTRSVGDDMKPSEQIKEFVLACCEQFKNTGNVSGVAPSL